ncbi:MAG: 2-dehydro-3-deoxygalactonokinase [Spirochaetia bacterium]|jgi:2-dehydro-3-deoxygalactonokinase
MRFATIDCGTTNSRVYVVDENGKVLGRASRKVGVRDTAINGNNQALKNGLREAFDSALVESGACEGEIRCILSSGMITSELGLIEIPHLWAPCSVEALAAHIQLVADLGVFPSTIPLYFVPGIKNLYAPASATMRDVRTLDFMRGEETQVAGLLARSAIPLPGVVVILSSHTKFIPLDGTGGILGSVTTLSGQLYEAIIKETFVGKSIRKEDDFEDGEYFNPAVVDLACECVESSGLLRSLMFPRFLDTLLHIPWYDRKLFTETLLAAEDIRALEQVKTLMDIHGVTFALVGVGRRCSIYRHLLEKTIRTTNSTFSITREEEIDQLSIQGIISIAEKAGILI